MTAVSLIRSSGPTADSDGHSHLEKAFQEFQQHPYGSPLIPEWRRIEVAVDGILNELVEAFDSPGLKPGKTES